MLRGYVPAGFKHAYIVPVPKLKDSCVKSISYDDFTGIAISPIISKVGYLNIVYSIGSNATFSVLTLSLVLRKVRDVEMQFTQFVKLLISLLMVVILLVYVQ